jgi:CSLREA domain-containing protein
MRRWTLLALFAALPARADVFTVTKTEDTADGACSVEDCSLREAVIAANALAGPDAIALAPGTYALAIAGAGEDAAATGDLDLLDEVTLDGAAATSTVVDGGALDRVFDVRCACAVTLREFTVRNGRVENDEGAGIAADAARLSLLRVRVVDNDAIWSNPQRGTGGGIALRGQTHLELDETFVAGNTARLGAGLGSVGLGTGTIDTSTFVDNAAAVGGGGAYVVGTFTIAGSTFESNTAQDNSGGLLGAGEVRLLTSTVSNNAAPLGAAIGHVGGGMALENATLFANDGVTAVYVVPSATLSLRNSILYDEVSSSECGAVGTFRSFGYNLDRDGSCLEGGTGDLPSTDPKLGPLELAGAITATHAPLPGSPAIDAGNPGSLCTDALAGPLYFDQRGEFRPVGRCDIGAVEYLPEPGAAAGVLAALAALGGLGGGSRRAR